MGIVIIQIFGLFFKWSFDFQALSITVRNLFTKTVTGILVVMSLHPGVFALILTNLRGNHWKEHIMNHHSLLSRNVAFLVLQWILVLLITGVSVK